MKEYVILPLREFNDLNSRTKKDTPGDSSIEMNVKELINSESLDTGSRLKLISTLQKKTDDNRIPDVNKEKYDNKEKIKHIIKDQVPFNKKDIAMRLTDFLYESPQIHIDEFGTLTYKERDVHILKLVKGIITPNAGVREIRSILLDLFEILPEEYILNNKAVILKDSLRGGNNNNSGDVRLKQMTKKNHLR